ncbi:hypothetical protein QBC38DRAFT_489330 [Podospora fimiseda]|uniref:Uncharacterized protein n=1 Tax=Podospora fimiseda TaxID=252190 RepID=A0AAN6YT91_9PEZI|nr:hypothetical protein QBC38DRAFT_489330 [Podospora fimiseda]
MVSSTLSSSLIMSSVSSTTCGRATPDSGMTVTSNSHVLPTTSQNSIGQIPRTIYLKGSIPSPNKMFMLTDHKFEYALSVQDVDLKFVEIAADNSIHSGMLCWPLLWFCTENRGWLGLRNAASGKYLGVTHIRSHTRVLASDSEPRTNNRLNIRLDTEGRGYTLQIFHDERMAHVTCEQTEIEKGPGRLDINSSTKTPMLWNFTEII